MKKFDLESLGIKARPVEEIEAELAEQARIQQQKKESDMNVFWPQSSTVTAGIGVVSNVSSMANSFTISPNDTFTLNTTAGTGTASVSGYYFMSKEVSDVRSRG